MDNDSKAKILEEWNMQGLEIETPWRKLVFISFDQLYRFLKEYSQKRGQESRKSRLDFYSIVNIASPDLKDRVVENRKKENEKLSRATITFLNRIKNLRSKN